MLDYDYSLWNDGYTIAGIDEVGRGCLFGDVVAAAVILPRFHDIKGINDSKKLTSSQRENLFSKIYEVSLSVGIGIVDVKTINQINIKQASRLAMIRAVQQLKVQPDVLVVDAEKLDSEIPQIALIHGDTRSQSIAAASIIAKVTRDRMCEDWNKIYPLYGISKHKGYGTKFHQDQIIQHGITDMHRKLFVRKLIQKS